MHCLPDPRLQEVALLKRCLVQLYGVLIPGAAPLLEGLLGSGAAGPGSAQLLNLVRGNRGAIRAALVQSESVLATVRRQGSALRSWVCSVVCLTSRERR